MAKWIGERIRLVDSPLAVDFDKAELSGRWTPAAFGHDGRRYAVATTMRPEQSKFQPLGPFLEYPLQPLSERAARGFLGRARAGKLRFGDGFLDSLERYLDGTRAIDEQQAAA